MLKASQLRSLISVENISSGLLDKNFVRSKNEFDEFKDVSKGIPILIPADETLFEFDNDEIFEVPFPEIAALIYGENAEAYVGFQSSFLNNRFVSSFKVREEFLPDFQRIEVENKRAIEYVANLRQSHKTVSAFQTRNIPHFGHQKIMDRMLARCEHLVVNPVLGPKKSGDATIECLSAVFGDFFKSRFSGRISFMPVYANMYYAGPREAVHHAILRRNMGFTGFSVGRDHAGAEDFFDIQAAATLIKSLQSRLNIDVFCHMGAKHCSACGDYIISGDCEHGLNQLKDVSGSQFRHVISNGQIFDAADKKMQKFVFQNVEKIFED
jgi:sulfate adenylyltransferase